MALTDNIANYYKLDDNSNDSVGSKNGTDTNINYVAGLINQAASFNGSNSQISTSGFTIGTVGSISFWYNFSGTSNSQYFIDASSGNRFLFGKNGTNTALWLINNTTIVNPTGNILPTTTGGWHHVVLTWDNSLGSNKEKIYIDGSLAGQYNVSITGTTPTNMYFGTAYFGANYLNGKLDEIGFWTRALSSTEVTALYNSGSGLQYPFITTSIKTINGLIKASVKTVNGLAIASVKSVNGLT